MSIYNKEQWSNMIEFLTEAMIQFELALRPILAEIKKELK
jgi:hypothetical protein